MGNYTTKKGIKHFINATKVIVNRGEYAKVSV